MSGLNGSSSYGASANNAVGPPCDAIGPGAGLAPPPPWKFGLRMSDDRRDM